MRQGPERTTGVRQGQERIEETRGIGKESREVYFSGLSHLCFFDNSDVFDLNEELRYFFL